MENEKGKNEGEKGEGERGGRSFEAPRDLLVVIRLKGEAS